MHLRQFLLLFALFCFLAAGAQGDEFLQVINKPKNDPQVLALLEKAKLKFKYGDNGYTHGDTYVSESETETNRYYMYAIVASVVKSITFYHTNAGEGRPCPFALPTGITNDMTLAQMKKNFGTTYDSIINSPYTTYTSTDYYYRKGTTKITFNFSGGTVLNSTTLTYENLYAAEYYENKMNETVSEVMKNFLQENPDLELVFIRQSHTDVSDTIANLENGFWSVFYDTITIRNVKAGIQTGGKNVLMSFDMPTGPYTGVVCQPGGSDIQVLKKTSGRLFIRFQSKAKPVAVHYALFRSK